MKKHTGFTLVELAVVIFIIGLLSVMGIGAFKAQMMNAAIRTTEGNQGAIKDAIMAYLAKNKRLPCPATPATNGAEGRDTSVQPPNCVTYYGLVPYATLDLSKSTAMDGWEDFFAYGVSPRWTATYSTSGTDPYKTTASAAAFSVGIVGVIAVNDINQSTGSSVPATTTAAAVVISQGANGLGAYTAKLTQNDATGAGQSETANVPAPSFSTAAIPAPATLTFFKRDYTTNTAAQGGAFDDVVLIVNPGDLLTPLMRDGALQSAQSQYSDEVVAIQDFVASYIAANPCNVPSVSTIQSKFNADPWGNTLNAAGSPFQYTPYSFSSSVPATYTLSNTTPTASPASISPSGATMIRIYPFLNNGC